MRNQTVSTFMLEAANERAEQVIAEAQDVVLPANYFDALMEALSKPPRPNKRLAELARRPRRYVQRW